MGTASFPGVKRPGRGVDHPLPSRAEVKERVVIPLLTLWDFVICFRVNFTFPLPYFSKRKSSPPCSTYWHAGLIDPWRQVPSKRRCPHGVTSRQSWVTVSVIIWYILRTWIIFAYSSVCFCRYEKCLCSISAQVRPAREICYFMNLWLSISTNYVKGSARPSCILLAEVPTTKALREFQYTEWFRRNLHMNMGPILNGYRDM